MHNEGVELIGLGGMPEHKHRYEILKIQRFLSDLLLLEYTVIDLERTFVTSNFRAKERLPETEEKSKLRNNMEEIKKIIESSRKDYLDLKNRLQADK